MIRLGTAASCICANKDSTNAIVAGRNGELKAFSLTCNLICYNAIFVIGIPTFDSQGLVKGSLWRRGLRAPLETRRGWLWDPLKQSGLIEEAS